MAKDILDPPGPPPQPPLPPLQHVLDIAKRGATDPSKLTDDDVRDLAMTLLVHYAHMGIRGDDGG